MDDNSGNAVLDMSIQGMSCTACAARIEKAIGKLDGVSGISVHYAAKSGSVQYAPGRVSPNRIMERIGELGFQAFPYGNEKNVDETSALRLRFVISLLLTLPLLGAMVHHYDWLRGVPVPGFLQDPMLQFVLAAIVQFGLGMPFYFGAYYALRERTANMDVLVVLGTTAAFAYSYFAMLTSQPLYFETSAVVITAILLGKWLESAASERAMRESDGFASLLLKEAVVVRGGLQQSVPVQMVRTGETVIAQPKLPIPVDGIILSGHAEVDESFLTGESMPAVKGPGDVVYAGTVPAGGILAIQVQTPSSDTMLSRIAVLTRQAQSTKSSIGRKVDRLAAVFVPVMIGMSCLTLLIWLLVLEPGDVGTASVHALAVLLAACPCALGLAAPISLVLASGKLARRGIVLKEAGTLEGLAQLDTIMLDKTGTLTEGKPVLSEMISIAPASPSMLLRLAAAVEQDSSHPYARTIVDEAKRKGLVIPLAEGFRSTPGKGVEAAVDGQLIAIGSAKLITDREWQITHAVSAFAQRMEDTGSTVLYIFTDGRCSGAFALNDPVKRTSSEAVRMLREEGVQVLLVTGDHPAAARGAALAAGIERVEASMLPEDKAAFVRKLQAEGRQVGMAGDGWNDAPAIAAADVGIAMGNGTEVALAAGHVVLLRPRLTGISDALRISKLTVRNIRQNLAFAFVYNAVVIPFAAFGGLEPWMAGTAMAFSSVSVVGNSLRLNGQMRRALKRSD
ncbi:heavy metal translocating P-type ATPase [Paenibacillus mendelii]|uniref:P-type Cu(+) transporter n=1 Tax=Paenibacillus mendelii TaxID=206163 RepID=A0ABV6JGD1_9BACL|nr:heavy metal translocating P-type ATPase [Paenibacillus mendelii]MCQ6557819.1 heavy metal translocating P-type ATPase [Paenibacillus mendelii]